MVRKYILRPDMKYIPKDGKTVKPVKEEPKKKSKLFGLADTITFGKYKGYKVIDAIDDGAAGYSYIAWAINTIDWFKLDKDAFIYAKNAEKTFESLGQSVTIIKPYKF